jgi:hypothetical protein
MQEVVAKFNAHKGTVPVYGAILLNEAMDKVLLARAMGGRMSWGWPRGKLENQDQSSCFACARREVCPFCVIYDVMKTPRMIILQGTDRDWHCSTRCTLRLGKALARFRVGLFRLQKS